MAIVDFAPSHRSTQSVARIFHAVGEWIAIRRAEHARYVALQQLMSEPEHRLRDLGIRREDLILSMEIHRK